MHDNAGQVIGTQGFYIDVTPTGEIQAAIITEAVAEIAENRAAIEQAKGILMLVYRIQSDAAFDLLKWRSQETNAKLRVLARTAHSGCPRLGVRRDRATPLDVRPATAYYASARQGQGREKTSGRRRVGIALNGWAFGQPKDSGSQGLNGFTANWMTRYGALARGTVFHWLMNTRSSSSVDPAKYSRRTAAPAGCPPAAADPPRDRARRWRRRPW